MKYLIVGLGNIGKEYALTRHNAGFMVVDHIAAQHRVEITHDRLASKAEVRYKSRHLHLIKPSNYMNQSGKAVSYWLKKLAIPKFNLLVIVDDIALPFGRVRLRARGNHGGHNGLANIEESILGSDYARLRMGIGNDFPKGGQVDYVLSSFNQAEQKRLPELMERTEQIVYSFCFLGINQTMNMFNTSL